MKDVNQEILFCPQCFASEEDGSMGGSVFPTYCTNCGTGWGDGAPKLKRYMVDSIRQQASWIGCRFYPGEEDRERHKERERLLSLVTNFPGRSVKPSKEEGYFEVMQKMDRNRTMSVFIKADSPEAAAKLARGSLPFYDTSPE